MTKQTKEFDLTIVYKVGTGYEINGNSFDNRLCDNEDYFKSCLKNGWHKTTDGAVKASRKSPKLKAVK